MHNCNCISVFVCMCCFGDMKNSMHPMCYSYLVIGTKNSLT